MGEMIEMFQALRQIRTDERRERASKAPEQIAELGRLGYTVTTLSQNGPHLRINDRVDYWPSTSRWHGTGTRHTGFGFEKLVAALPKHVRLDAG